MNSLGSGGHRSRWLPWTVLGLASVLLLGSLAVVASGAGQFRSPSPGDRSLPGGYGGRPSAGRAPAERSRSGPGGMMGGRAGNTMMGGHVWLAGNNVPVSSIPAARERAAAAAGPRGLHPGEVMQFSQNFYVELKDAAGVSAAEVLVDPASGSVVTEYGPAMMWSSDTAAPTVSLEQATTIANEWLAGNAPAERVDSADSFPGHFTMDTVSAGHTVGMLSVNAVTGAVSYHTWHGTFIAKEDA